MSEICLENLRAPSFQRLCPWPHWDQVPYCCGQEALTLTQASLCLPCPSLSKDTCDAAHSTLLDN